MNQKTKAETFRALHKAGEILVLPNCWDAASAAIMADAGARAVATSSAAVAWSHGYPDGDLLPFEKVLATVSACARVIDVPLTADIESGYTDDLAELGDNIRKVIEAGAVGINLEDGRRDMDLHTRKVETARKAADATGVPLFINARIDVYLKGLAEGQAAYAETLARAEAYQAAGADGIFVPGPHDPDLIGRLASEIRLPLNIMLWPDLPPAARLQALGVRRISSGGSPFAAVYASLARATTAYLADGGGAPFADRTGLPNFNQRFSG